MNNNEANSDSKEHEIECPGCLYSKSKKIDALTNYVLRECIQCGLVFSVPMVAGDVNYYKGHLVYSNVSDEEAIRQLRSIDSRANRGLLRRFPIGSRTLDIGCGYGAFVSLSTSLGMRAEGIDFNREAIEVGKRAFKLTDSLYLSNVETMFNTQTSPKYDLVTLFEVIEHVENPRQLVQDVFKALKPGGILAMSCPNENRWQPLGRIFVDYPPHHLTRWTPKSLERMLNNVGFVDVSVVPDSSLRDLIWTYAVNRSAKNRVLEVAVQTIPTKNLSHYNFKRAIKRFAYDISKYIFIPIDFFLRVFGVGTMGMRTIAKKPEA